MKKYINKYLVLSLIGLFLIVSCDDGDAEVDGVVANTTRGAALRTINIISNELPIGADNAGFAAEFEVQDIEQGTLVSSIDVYVAFRDNTVESGAPDLDVAEALFSTISSDTFENGPFGLPRTSFSASLTEMLAFTGVLESDLFGGDQFQIRFELVLSDGRTFSSTNSNAPNLGGSFYNSPFIYFPTITCAIDESAFIGDYIVNQVTPGIFGLNTWEDGSTVTLSMGSISSQRQFTARYLPDAGVGQSPATFAFDLVCGSVNPLSAQATGIGCAGSIELGPPAGATGTYDPADDSVFTIVLSDDESSGCSGGGPVDAEVRLTKL